VNKIVVAPTCFNNPELFCRHCNVAWAIFSDCNQNIKIVNRPNDNIMDSGLTMLFMYTLWT